MHRSSLGFLLIGAAALVTPLGALVGVSLPSHSAHVISMALAFATGVLVWVALVGLHPEAMESFHHHNGKWLPRFFTMLSIMAGMATGAAIHRTAHWCGFHHGDETVVEQLVRRDTVVQMQDHPELAQAETARAMAKEEQGMDESESVVLQEMGGARMNQNRKLKLKLKHRHGTDCSEGGSCSRSVRAGASGNEPSASRSRDSRTPLLKENHTAGLDTVNDKSALSGAEGDESGFALTRQQSLRLKGVGVFTAIAVCIHNLPEGLATYTSTIANEDLGVLVAVAVALHNIPLGVTVGMPVFLAERHLDPVRAKAKAVLYATAAGMSSLVGGLLGYLAFKDGMHDNSTGVTFGFVIGIMLWTAFRELLPQAREHDRNDKYTSMLIFAGFLAMDVSLVIFDKNGGHEH